MEHHPILISGSRLNGRVVRRANDNGNDRRVVVRLRPPTLPCTAEIEVFGAILAALTPANDNDPSGDVP